MREWDDNIQRLRTWILTYLRWDEIHPFRTRSLASVRGTASGLLLWGLLALLFGLPVLPVPEDATLVESAFFVFFEMTLFVVMGLFMADVCTVFARFLYYAARGVGRVMFAFPFLFVFFFPVLLWIALWLLYWEFRGVSVLGSCLGDPFVYVLNRTFPNVFGYDLKLVNPTALVVLREADGTGRHVVVPYFRFWLHDQTRGGGRGERIDAPSLDVPSLDRK